jgi:branched-chain amino acid transport system ATP-binding protein
MLQVDEIDVFYGDVQVLKGVTLDVAQGELVAVIGSNGAGKTTLIKTISGLLKPRHGSISLDGKRISGMDANRVVAHGVAQVPEGRLLFPDMSVRENLEMGGYVLKGKDELAKGLESVYGLFPNLREREKQTAGTLSGGEQQMVAVGRALMSSPKLIMFDEPSLGLAPKLVQTIFDMVLRINHELGMTVLLVEQNVALSCEMSSRAFVLEDGAVTVQGKGSEMLANEHVRRAYMGL